MSDHSVKRERGFTLLEMVVAMALGTVVLGGAVTIYVQGVGATWTNNPNSANKNVLHRNRCHISVARS